MKNERPKSLYTLPTEDMLEGEVLADVNIQGFDRPPGVGAYLLAFPADQRQRLRTITHLYRVVGVEEQDDRDWPWWLDLENEVVPTPLPWHTITEHLMFEGLKSVTGVRGEGDRVVDPATLDEIFRLLGFTF